MKLTKPNSPFLCEKGTATLCHSGATNLRSVRGASQKNHGYDRIFWLTYAANAALMMSVSILFRYADFVAVAGGSAGHLGLIVGVGTLGALAMRIIQGIGIDRFGPRLVWLLSLSLFVISLLCHLEIGTIHGPAVYLARILMMTSTAGAFAASIAFISLRVEERRMAEMIGTLGSSGFIGMALGPTLGDILFGDAQVTRQQIDQMFVLAATAAAVSLALAAIATRCQLRPAARRRPPTLRIIGKYHPGILLFVAIAMGWGIGLPHTFLRPYTASLQITGIKTFFLVYAATAFLVRISIRRMPEQYGLRPMILAGMSTLSVSMLLFLVVQSQWQLAIPAVFSGTAHAFLFPSVLASGCSTFPVRYRGLATTLILAMFDLGNLLGQPAVGGIIELSSRAGWPPFATMFVIVSIGILSMALLFAFSKEKVLRRSTAGGEVPNSNANEAHAPQTMEGVVRC